ncbi:hypothetical protein ACJA25_01265 [Mycoplasmopsis hyopharyngis]|uniref:hypothetical protein n=1 Tax=Mycoplasmopsis hyopharyngis TaxID=29558 RepID=UPI0038739269
MKKYKWISAFALLAAAPTLSSTCVFTKEFWKFKKSSQKDQDKSKAQDENDKMRNFKKQINFDADNKEKKYADQIMEKEIYFEGINSNEYVIDLKIKETDVKNGTLTFDAKIIEIANPKNVIQLENKIITGFKKQTSFSDIKLKYLGKNKPYKWHSYTWDFDLEGLDKELYTWQSIAMEDVQDGGKNFYIEILNKKDNAVVFSKKFYYNDYAKNNIEAYVDDHYKYFNFEVTRDMVHFKNVDHDNYEIIIHSLDTNAYNDCLRIGYTLIWKNNRNFKYSYIYEINGFKKFDMEIGVGKPKDETYTDEVRFEDIIYKCNEKDYVAKLYKFYNFDDDTIKTYFQIYNKKEPSKIYDVPFSLTGFIRTNISKKQYNVNRIPFKNEQRKTAHEITEEDILSTIEYDQNIYNAKVEHMTYVDDEKHAKPYIRANVKMEKKTEPYYRSKDNNYDFFVYFYDFEEFSAPLKFLNKDKMYPSDYKIWEDSYNVKWDIIKDEGTYEYKIENVRTNDLAGEITYDYKIKKRKTDKVITKTFVEKDFRKIDYKLVESIELDTFGKSNSYASHFYYKAINVPDGWECFRAPDSICDFDDFDGTANVAMIIKKKDSEAKTIKRFEVSGFKKLEGVKLYSRKVSKYNKIRSMADQWDYSLDLDSSIYKKQRWVDTKLYANPMHPLHGYVQFTVALTKDDGGEDRFSFSMFGYTEDSFIGVNT